MVGKTGKGRSQPEIVARGPLRVVRGSLPIGKLASLVGLTTRTIRYYEEIGLLNSVKRVEGGKRIYTNKDYQRLRFVKRLKDLGLTLAEMQELEDIYQIDRTNRRVLQRLLELLEHHANRIDERVRNLSKLRNEIVNYQQRIKRNLNREEQAAMGEKPK